MKYEYMMLDGMRVGVNVNDTCSLELDKAEKQTLLKVMKAIPKAIWNESKKEYFVIKPKHDSDMNIVLRKHNQHEKWYLNISGNPVNHFIGQSIYGDSRAGWQIRATFRLCLAWLERNSKIKVNQSLFDKVINGLINIHNIEFAVYTNKIKGDIKQLISAWQYMYRASNWKEKGIHKSLDKLLNINSRINDEEYENSFALSTMIIEAGKRYRTVSLCIYQKADEVANKGGSLSEIVTSDIQDRLRIDMELSLRWMSRAGIRTLADLEAYVLTKHEGDWKIFIQAELKKTIDKTALTYMWTFPNIFSASERKKIPIQWFDGVEDTEVKEWAEKTGINYKIGYKAHVAMMDARLKEHVTGEEVMLSLKSKEDYLQLAEKTSMGLTNDFTKMQVLAVKTLTFDDGAPDEL